MNNKLIGMGLSLALIGSAIPAIDVNKAEAEVVSQESLESKYRDGRYDSITDHTTMGYKVGQVLYDGNTVVRVSDKVNSYFSNIKDETEYNKYVKSGDSTKVNNVVIKTPNGYYQVPLRVNYYVQTLFNSNQIINDVKINNEFIRLVNIDRASKGVSPVVYNSNLKEGTDTRAQELSNYGHIRVDGLSHVRLDKTKYYTAFSDYIPDAQYQIGENLAMRSYNGNPYYLVSEKRIAQDFFNQFKNSQSHYDNLMNPKYKSMAIAVKLGSDNLMSPYSDYFYAANSLSIK